MGSPEATVPAVPREEVDIRDRFVCEPKRKDVGMRNIFTRLEIAEWRTVFIFLLTHGRTAASLNLF